MKTKLTALAFLLLPTISIPTFAEGFTNTIDGFTNNGDGTVTDTKTGLVWQSCAVGQTFEPSFGTCLGEAKKFKWQDDNDDTNSAINITSDFGGKTDWRLPTISELLSIVDLKKDNPSINKSLFPNPPTNWFWSSSPYPDSSYYAWVVTTGSGYSGDGYKGNSHFVRLVRGSGDSVFSLLSLSDFVDNKDGTVTHKKTGLTWQRCAAGQTWNAGYCDGKAATYKQTDAVKLTSDMAGQTDWRLPSLRELQTIVDYSTFKPSTNLVLFPDAPSVKFWTTTPKAERENNFWFVGFGYGTSNYDSKTTAYAARLVRGSMTSSTTTTPTTTTPSGNVDLNATLTANPSPAKINQTLTYSATVTNKGKATATGTTLTFYVAPKFMSYTASSNGCELKNNGLSVVCNIGDLAAGANVTKTMNVIMQKSGGVSSSVFAKSNETDANPTDNIGRAATGVKK